MWNETLVLDRLIYEETIRSDFRGPSLISLSLEREKLLARFIFN